MISGLSTPAFSTTKRDLMPEAFSMNSTDEGCLASSRPSAMSLAWLAFQRSVQALRLATSSALEIEWGGV